MYVCMGRYINMTYICCGYPVTNIHCLQSPSECTSTDGFETPGGGCGNYATTTFRHSHHPTVSLNKV